MKPSPQLAALFLLAVTGLLGAVGVILGNEVGAGAAGVYTGVTTLLVLFAAVRAQRALRVGAPAGEHNCACCSGEPFTGVTVI